MKKRSMGVLGLVSVKGVRGVLGAMIAAGFLASLAPARENPVDALPPRLVQEMTFHREGKGIRVKPPGPDAAEGSSQFQNHWLMEFPLALSGPFEVVASFEVNQLGQTNQQENQQENQQAQERGVANQANSNRGSPERTVHAQILLQSRSMEGHYGISIASDPHNGGGQPACFKVTRAEPWPEGLHSQSLSFPRKANVGRVAIRREGSQLIFLAADGADAEFRELVRLAYDSRVEPTLGLAAYQGKGSELMPVDLLFANIDVKAGKILKGPQVQRAFIANIDVGDYPGMVDYRDRPGSFLNDSAMTTVNRGEAFHVDGAMLRVCPPMCPIDLRGASSYWARELKQEVRGDFELSATFDLLAMGPPAPGGNGAIGVFLGLDSAGPLGSIHFGRGCVRNPASGRLDQGYILMRSSPCAATLAPDGRVGPNKVQEVIHFPTRAKKGRLILRRIGEEIHFLVEEEKGSGVVLYKTFASVDPAAKLQLVADQGGSPATPIDVQLSRIVLKANALVTEGEKIPLSPATVIDLEPKRWELSREDPPTRIWWYATLSAGTLAGALSLSMLLFRRGLF